MDLTPFFHNVERIATALETIARNTAPFAQGKPLLSEEAAAKIREIISGPPPEPTVIPWDQVNLIESNKAEPATTETPSVERIPDLPGYTIDEVNDAIRTIYAGGTQTANGIAKAMRERGIPHPHGNQWNNVSAKKLMEPLGLSSPYSVKPAAPDPTPDPTPEPEPEPEPEKPKVNRAFVERNWKPRRTDDGHMNMRGLLTPETNARLETFEAAKAEGRQPTDQELIEAALAAGRVTKLPAGIDSTGHNHLETSGSCTIKGRGTGVALGSHGPTSSGVRVGAVVRSQ